VPSVDTDFRFVDIECSAALERPPGSRLYASGGLQQFGTTANGGLFEGVARAVAREIKLRLTSQQQVELSRPHSVDPEAFDAYLQGYHCFERDTSNDTDGTNGPSQSRADF